MMSMDEIKGGYTLIFRVGRSKHKQKKVVVYNRSEILVDKARDWE